MLSGIPRDRAGWAVKAMQAGKDVMSDKPGCTTLAQLIRLDWFTPDALPTWGDGRLTILGTEGYIELRKYVDVGGDAGTDHLILVTGDRCEKIDASDAGMPYFARLTADICNRTETAMPQAHAFKVCELALKAQALAEARA